MAVLYYVLLLLWWRPSSVARNGSDSLKRHQCEGSIYKFNQKNKKEPLILLYPKGAPVSVRHLRSDAGPRRDDRDKARLACSHFWESLLQFQDVYSVVERLDTPYEAAKLDNLTI